MARRKINCPHCDKHILVSPRAVSVNCPYCYQRVSVENFVIDAYHAVTNIETSGSLDIAHTGHVRASIHVQDLNLAGQLYGNVTAGGKVAFEAGAQHIGDITATRLDVASGAKLKGFCRIEPTTKPKKNHNDTQDSSDTT